VAIISGLAHRKKQTGNAVHYIHTAGTSSLGDNQIRREYIESRILSDKDVYPSSVFSYLKFRQGLESYSQRTTDIATVEKGVEVAVPTYLLMSPTIYGRGSGAFNKSSIQIPGVVRSALKLGYVPVLGKGDGAWDSVHIDDLVLVYELFVSKILAGEDTDLPSGEKGIYFTETGDFTWRALSEGVARELLARGVVKSDEVREMSLEGFAEIFTGGDGQYSELAFGSTSRSRADLTRELGWKPKHVRWDFFEGIKEEVEAVLRERK
jgi:nucleoside-diphosphate-sugar epimerase